MTALQFLLRIDVTCLWIEELGWYCNFVFFTDWCVNLLNDNTWWLWIAIYLFWKNSRTSSFKLSVPYKKDATIKSDSKQRMMSLQDRMEPDRNCPTMTKLQFENPHCKHWFFITSCSSRQHLNTLKFSRVVSHMYHSFTHDLGVINAFAE